MHRPWDTALPCLPDTLCNLCGKSGVVQNKLDVDSVAVIANKDNGSGSIAVMVGKNVQAKGIKAGDIVKDLAKACNGKGGGRPDRAQAGTREPEKIAEAIANANNWIRAKLGA